MQTDALNSPTRPHTERTSASRVVIVADDLTGACDSAVAFLASGRPVRVMLDPPPGRTAPASHPRAAENILSYTTETRNLPPEEASARVAQAIAVLADAQPNAIFFKKVDSAARGNFGPETVAALTASRAPLALVAPAFPQAERTLHSGILSVRDCSGQNSRISLRDQFSNLDSTRVQVLRTGSQTELLLGIRRAIANGVQALLCDADTQEDLERLASAGTHLSQTPLWAGSAGLARALAGVLPAALSESAFPKVRRSGRTLLFAGSPHPVTLLQLSRLEEQPAGPGVSVLRVDLEATSPQQIRQAHTAAPAAALILTGGDTAAFVLRSLGASSILLAGELAPGIPWGFIEDGLADGCIAVTKSGGFGGPNALVDAAEFCARRSM